MCFELEVPVLKFLNSAPMQRLVRQPLTFVDQNLPPQKLKERADFAVGGKAGKGGIVTSFPLVWASTDSVHVPPLATSDQIHISDRVLDCGLVDIADVSELSTSVENAEDSFESNVVHPSNDSPPPAEINHPRPSHTAPENAVSDSISHISEEVISL